MCGNQLNVTINEGVYFQDPYQPQISSYVRVRLSEIRNALDWSTYITSHWERGSFSPWTAVQLGPGLKNELTVGKNDNQVIFAFRFIFGGRSSQGDSSSHASSISFRLNSYPCHRRLSTLMCEKELVQVEWKRPNTDLSTDFPRHSFYRPFTRSGTVRISRGSRVTNWATIFSHSLQPLLSLKYSSAGYSLSTPFLTYVYCNLL